MGNLISSEIKDQKSDVTPLSPEQPGDEFVIIKSRPNPYDNGQSSKPVDHMSDTQVGDKGGQKDSDNNGQKNPDISNQTNQDKKNIFDNAERVINITDKLSSVSSALNQSSTSTSGNTDSNEQLKHKEKTVLQNKKDLPSWAVEGFMKKEKDPQTVIKADLKPWVEYEILNKCT